MADDQALEVCLGSSCRDAGSEFLVQELRKLGPLSLQTTFCQGHCAIGPNVRLRGGEAGLIELSGQGPDQANSLAERIKKSTETPEKPFK